MSDKKQAEKQASPTTDFLNPICQDTFESLPKIYGTIKNKIISNKISFYQNIKRKQRVNLMKSFNKNDIIEQTAKIISPKHKQKSINRSLIQKKKKKQIKVQEIDINKMARFEDKFHKLDNKFIPKHSRVKTTGEADDNQSKHKIKFNTIKFLPLIHHHQHSAQEIYPSYTSKEHVSKSVSIKTPLTNLYRQDKQKDKIKYEKGENQMQSGSPNGINRKYNTAGKQTNIKERVKTEQDSEHETTEIRRSSFKTQFSRRLHDQKLSNTYLNTHSNKFHIPKRQEYKNFIQSYHPLNPNFNLKKLIKEKNFQIISYQDGVYLGTTQLGVKLGEGVLVTQTSIFQGLFQDDEKVKGTQQNIDGKYVGFFKNGQRQGKGRYQWQNGQLFEGEWRQGKKNGYGIWQSPNGDSYVGNWLNGRQHGTGTHTHKNSVYKGEFINSLKHGYGEQSFANGDKFKGNYEHGKPEGKGRYEWTDGSYYQGNFRNGYRDGEGLLKEIDGSIYKVKALSKEILSTVWVNRYINPEKNTRFNIEMVLLSQKSQQNHDHLSYLNRLILSFLYRNH